MKSKRKIGVEQIFDNYLLFILFEPVNLMNIRYIFTTLLFGAVQDSVLFGTFQYFLLLKVMQNSF